MKHVVLWAIAIYRNTISLCLSSTCRYLPSCSRYTQEAVERYGAIKGTWIGLKRLARCQPLGGQGYDPVP